MKIKQKVKTKTEQTDLDIFLNQTLHVLTDCLLWFIQIKMTKLKDIISNYNVIINGKNFYDQPIDSDVKRYEEIS